MGNVSHDIQYLGKNLDLGLPVHEVGMLTSLQSSVYICFVLLDLITSIIYFFT